MNFIVVGPATLTILDPNVEIRATFATALTLAASVVGNDEDQVWLNINTEADPITGNSTVWWRGVPNSWGTIGISKNPTLLFEPSAFPAPQLPGDDKSIHYRPNTKALHIATPPFPNTPPETPTNTVA